MQQAEGNVQLGCGVLGDKTIFSVGIPRSASVADVQKAIFHEKRYGDRNSFSASDLKLRLARKEGGEWLQANQDVIHLLRSRHIDEEYKQMVPLLPLFKNEAGQGYLEAAFKPGVGEIHVLVELPLDCNPFVRPIARKSVLHEVEGDRRELEYYQQQGATIRTNCDEYCSEILRKIDDIYTSRDYPPPFICVVASSGMGKTQLAFALEGRRPWFYWVATPERTDSQVIYKSFSSISREFSACVDMDGLMQREEADVLNSFSVLYDDVKLWTYGFIRALLEYCGSEEQQRSRMIRFDESVTLNVRKCCHSDVYDVIGDLKAQKKVLPFFILDEMTTREKNTRAGEMRAAFQRNIFRTCGLAVVIMGTDSKIAQLMAPPSGHSSTGKPKRQTIVPRFPPYHIKLRSDSERQAWEVAVEQYPVIESIARRSRGRFARCFLGGVVKYVMDRDNSSVVLFELLDDAFGAVCYMAQKFTPYMSTTKGRIAQWLAMSSTNESAKSMDKSCGLPFYKRQKIAVEEDTSSMDVHFSNLAADHLADLYLSVDRLCFANYAGVWKSMCRFPDIDDDLLLYLAILGGKVYSGYYDCEHGVAHSTKSIFLEYLDGKGFPVDESLEAASGDGKGFENMISNAIVCASRKNGVQGILFDDFIGWLLGEFQDRSTKMAMTIRDGDSGGDLDDTIVASDLFDGCPRLDRLAHVKIPFLAPPNAVWPQCILAANDQGCNFGHLVRTPNAEIYIQDPDSEPDATTALLLCECKHWGRNLDTDAMHDIIGGLGDVWINASVVLFFCERLVMLGEEWGHINVGCVRIDCQSGHAEWVFQPGEGSREKMVIVMETRNVGLPARKSSSSAELNRNMTDLWLLLVGGIL